MKRFTALVIDDESKRNKEYLEVLNGYFDVSICNTIDDIDARDVRKYDMLVIDVGLGSQGNAFSLIEDLRIETPTVLVSGRWVNNENEPNDYILDVPRYRNIFKVLNWKRFEYDKENVSTEIYHAFCRSRNIAIVNDTDDCVILHISDLQFGGNTPGTTGNDNIRIAKKIKEIGKIPNLIVITGDIADKAKMDEYKAAIAWIEGLARELWDINGDLLKEVRERIILVPGNHDAEVSICASDLYQFSFGSSKIDDYVYKNDISKFDHQKLALYNFTKFAEELSKDSSWLHYMDKAVHFNEMYINYGINIINFNSVYGINSRNCENRHDSFYCDLSKIDDDELRDWPKRDNGGINLLIMHNPPKDFRQQNEHGEKSWGKFLTLIEDNKVSVCLYGHTHDNRRPYNLSESGGKYCDNMICIGAPSLRLAANSRTEDANRGFNIVEFIKDGKEFSKVKVTGFEINKASIVQVFDKKFDL